MTTKRTDKFDNDPLNHELHCFDTALRLIGIQITDKEIVELLCRLSISFAKKRGNFSVEDSCKILVLTKKHQESLKPKTGEAIKARKGRRISNP